MPLPDVRLSLLAFPQRWEANALQARVLLLPTDSPLAPPGFNLPQFAGTSWPLRVTLLQNPDDLLGPSPGSSAGAVSFEFTATPPAGAAALFEALAARLNPVPPKTLAERRARALGARVRKQLPESYTRAFPFERPGPDTSVGNEFGCALREAIPAKRDDPKPQDPMTWGAVLSFALRQPLIARALGLIYDIPFPAGVPGAMASGGWLYVTLDPGGAVQPASADAVRSYAVRLPVLAPGATRGLFAAVLLPVGLTGTADYGASLSEAAVYGDGFAKIVHASQAVTADAASSRHNELRPATDAGVDLGWDDEQVTVWLNRQLDALRARLDPSVKAMEAPLGVAGYRIDVRSPDLPGLATWHSLCRARSADASGAAAPLVFPPAPEEPVFTESFNGELTVEPAATRSIHATDSSVWLPQYFTRWLGGSLVVNDLTLLGLSGTAPLDANQVPINVPPPTYVAPTKPPALRYGTRYEFRCRLADLTGGGPRSSDEPAEPAPTHSTSMRFLRHVPPKTVRLKTNIAIAAPGDPTPSVAQVTRIDVWRPLIGYPEMVFAGIEDDATRAALLAGADAARDAGDAVGVNDPDVTHFRVAVQVRATVHDTGPPEDRDGDFRTLYTVEIPFPAFDADDVLDPGVPVTLDLEYVDIPDVAKVVHPAPGTRRLEIPAARDVRLRITPFCADKPDYFGAPWVQQGLTANVATRADARHEPDLFGPRAPDLELNGIMLQPAADIARRLADHLKLGSNGLTLTARQGERVVFGAAASLRYSLAPDRSSITFASENELLGHWITVITLDLARDWTWDGLDEQGFVVSRRDAPSGPERVVGRLPVPFVVARQAIAGNGVPGIDRRAITRLVFFDAIDPNPAAGKFPESPAPQWRFEPRLRGFTPAANAALAKTLAIQLPVAAPPRQTLKLVSAGIALSPYERADDYSSTDARRRVLWFELDAPVEDPHDVLFARVVAYGPDPLLSGTITHLLTPVPELPLGATTLFDLVEKVLPNPPEPPPLAIDPEPMRVIVPGQPQDRSGLDAMVEMVEGLRQPGDTRARHFIVPLPPGVAEDSPELFGFWSYELRIGHKAIWSTARARFGRPLVVKGVQHPAPALSCSAFRRQPPRNVPPSNDPRQIIVTAPFATAVFQDQRLTRPTAGDPRTRIWALLYAQVTQADGTSKRNVLLARAPAVPRFEMDDASAVLPPRTRDVIGVARFDTGAVESVLAELALPPDSPLSVVAVELLPGDHLVQTERPVFLRELEARGVADKVYVMSDLRDGSSQAASFAGVAGDDPLGRDLGSMASRRILRCSTLTPVAPTC